MLPGNSPDHQATTVCENKKCVPNDAALVALIAAHVEVTFVSDGKYVRWQLAKFTPVIQVDLICGVDRQHLIGIHRYQNRADICLINTHKIQKYIHILLHRIISIKNIFYIFKLLECFIVDVM